MLGQEIAFESAEGAGVGAQVPLEGRVVMSAAPTDQILVNGVELTADSSLRALRAALTHYGLSTSGPKAKAAEPPETVGTSGGTWCGRAGTG